MSETISIDRFFGMLVEDYKLYEKKRAEMSDMTSLQKSKIKLPPDITQRYIEDKAKRFNFLVTGQVEDVFKSGVWLKSYFSDSSKDTIAVRISNYCKTEPMPETMTVHFIRNFFSKSMISLVERLNHGDQIRTSGPMYKIDFSSTTYYGEDYLRRDRHGNLHHHSTETHTVRREDIVMIGKRIELITP